MPPMPSGLTIESNAPASATSASPRSISAAACVTASVPAAHAETCGITAPAQAQPIGKHRDAPDRSARGTARAAAAAACGATAGGRVPGDAAVAHQRREILEQRLLEADRHHQRRVPFSVAAAGVVPGFARRCEAEGELAIAYAFGGGRLGHLGRDLHREGPGVERSDGADRGPALGQPAKERARADTERGDHAHARQHRWVAHAAPPPVSSTIPSSPSMPALSTTTLSRSVPRLG